MRIPASIAATATLLAACGSGADGPVPGKGPSPAPSAERASRAAGWALHSSGEGAALVLRPGSGRAALRLFCPAGEERLLVNVPAFRPIGSEERLSFGSGGAAVALVADTNGDRERGGVSATGALPGDLAALIGGPLSIRYGAQGSGPHPAPPQALARAFVAACRESAPAAPRPAANPCLVQDGERLGMTPLRAVGTEPFWGARIEGRCVTYSHPEDQAGTRVWTRYTPGPDGGIWAGALGGRRFELRTRTRPGCSDGMSDRAYPVEVELIVNGERRTGCAEPL